MSAPPCRVVTLCHPMMFMLGGVPVQVSLLATPDVFTRASDNVVVFQTYKIWSGGDRKWISLKRQVDIPLGNIAGSYLMEFQ